LGSGFGIELKAILGSYYCSWAITIVRL